MLKMTNIREPKCLSSRGVQLSSEVYKTRNANMETNDHVFVECSSAKLVSAHLWHWVEWWPVNDRTVPAFWESFDRDNGNVVHRHVKRLIAAVFLWIVWKQRNERVFGRATKNEKAMSEEIQFVAFDWIKHRTKFGKFLSWENWCCNPLIAVSLCIALAPR